jgi:hypothetical protein
MTTAAKKSTRAAPKPKATVRRFDVFAEVKRLEARDDGMPAAQAKGYGLWVAKVVAARRFSDKKKESKTGDQPERKTKWRSLSGKPQTDKLFDKEIVSRMGRDFYRRVFSPKIKAAIDDGQDYMAMRDSIRKGWKAEAA